MTLWCLCCMDILDGDISFIWIATIHHHAYFFIYGIWGLGLQGLCEKTDAGYHNISKSGSSGCVAVANNGSLIIAKYNDSKMVLLLSTVQTSAMTETGKINRKTKEPEKRQKCVRTTITWEGLIGAIRWFHMVAFWSTPWCCGRKFSSMCSAWQCWIHSSCTRPTLLRNTPFCTGNSGASWWPSLLLNSLHRGFQLVARLLPHSSALQDVTFWKNCKAMGWRRTWPVCVLYVVLLRGNCLLQGKNASVVVARPHGSVRAARFHFAFGPASSSTTLSRTTS